MSEMADEIEQVILRGLIDHRVEVEGPDFDYADSHLIAYARSVRTALERASCLLPDSNLVWIVDTEAAHDQPFGVFTTELAAKDAVAKTPGTSWSSIFLNRIYT